MAQSQAVRGLIEQLGLGGVNETEAYHQGLGFNPSQQASGGSKDAVMAQLGQKLGRQIGGGIRTGIEHFKERGDGDSFSENARQAKSRWQSEYIAKGLGVEGTEDSTPGEVYQQKKATRGQVAAINLPPSGDDYKDQQAFLEEVQKIATRNGDSELATKAMKLQMQLKQEDLAMKDMESDFSKQESDRAKEKSEQREIVRDGDTPTRDYNPSIASWDPKAREGLGGWRVVHPDRSIEEYEHVRYFDRDAFGKQSGTASGSGSSEGLQSTANRAIGGGSARKAAHNTMEGMRVMSKIVKSGTDLLTGVAKPEAIMSWSGTLISGADKAIKFADTAWELANRQSIGTGTYTDKFSGAKFAGDEYVWNGKRMLGGEEEQKGNFFSAATEIIQNMPIPTELIAELAIPAGEWQAVIMELAYLDARLQEPSNRGLSDNDIKAALLRIGAFSANPVTFFNRQITIAEQNLNRLNMIGGQINHSWIKDKRSGEDVINWTRQQQIDDIYNGGGKLMLNPAYGQLGESKHITDPNTGYLNETKKELQQSIVDLNVARERAITRQREDMGLDDPVAPEVPADESYSERKARLLGE